MKINEMLSKSSFVALAAAFGLTFSAQATLVNHFTFDDPDNLLKATVGGDAVEYWNQKSDPDGDAEGSTMATPSATKLYAVAGEGQATSGAIAVPRYSGFGFTHALTDSQNYCVEMRCYLPDEGTEAGYHALMSETVLETAHQDYRGNLETGS